MILPPALDPRPTAGCDSGRHTQRRQPCAHLPTTLDLKAVTRPAWADYAAWVVSAVVIRRYIDRSADATTFVPLGSEYINKHIPAKVRKPLLADLRQNGVLDCDDLYYFTPYIPGRPGKCLCYRVGDRYRDEPIRPYTLKHTELLRKMATAYQQERAKVTDPTHLALRAWHDQVEVLPQAPKDEHPFLDKMIRGEPRFTDCSQGRVHTNVTNLPAQYRQYLRLVGRELDAVDICTSQPLILGLLLTGRTRNHGKRGRRGEGEDTRAIFNPSSDPSLNEFLRDCLDGVVYDRVVAFAKRYTRDEVKAMFLAVIYGHPDHMHTIIGEAVRELYSPNNLTVDAHYFLWLWRKLHGTFSKAS